MKKIFLIAAFGLMGFIAKAQRIIDVQVRGEGDRTLCQATVEFADGNIKYLRCNGWHLAGFNSKYIVFNAMWNGGDVLEIFDSSNETWKQLNITNYTVRSITEKSIGLDRGNGEMKYYYFK